MPSATIKLFLPHGDPKRLRTAEISNWSGKAVAAARVDFDALSFAKIFIHSVDDRRCSRDRLRTIQETVDRRGGQPCGSVGPLLKDAGLFWGWGGEPPDGRTGPIVGTD